MASSIGPLGAATSGLSPAAFDKARDQARELESVFLNTLMKQMFSTIKTDENAFGGGFAEETWRGMQAEQMADAISQSGGIGLADSILSDLLAARRAYQPTT